MVCAELLWRSKCHHERERFEAPKGPKDQRGSPNNLMQESDDLPSTWVGRQKETA